MLFRSEKKYGELEDQVRGLNDKATLTKSSYSDATFNSSSRPSSSTTSTGNTSSITYGNKKKSDFSKRPSWRGGKHRRTKKGRKSRRGRKTRKH